MNKQQLLEKLQLIAEMASKKKASKKKPSKKATSTKASSDTSGKMHELLVGFHLNQGRHMDPIDSTGESPQELHDRLQGTLHSQEYKRLHERARKAADHLRGMIPGKITNVRLTSKPGCIQTVTGIVCSQAEDASDLIVTAQHGKRTVHHGISLKASDSPKGSHHVGVSNPGLESTYGGRDFHDAHKQALLNAHPRLKKLSNKKQRKEWMEKNPKKAARIRRQNKDVLRQIAQHTANHLRQQGTKFTADHIRDHILRARPTPLQAAGHSHIRHATYTKNGRQEHHAVDPSTHWDHILRDHKNIEVDVRGTTIYFKHKNHGVFATHRMKFESQSDPLSSIKGFGNSAGNV